MDNCWSGYCGFIFGGGFMTLIIGGAYQGKTEFAVNTFGFTASEISDGFDKIEALLSAKCIRNFENFVFATAEKGKDPIDETTNVLLKNPDVVIIMNEIGGGIIPIEKAERKKREAAGRTGCMLAEKAETVVRLVCGIPTVLKGKLE